MKKSFILISCLVILFNLNLTAILYCNQIPPPVDGKSQDEIYVGSVEKASKYYFLFKSEINKYFSEVETKGLTAGKEYLNDSIIHLDLAINWFSVTKENIYLSDYQEDKYKKYDYSYFSDNPDYHKQTMAKVIEYFSDSDIKGFFGEIICSLKEIRELIENMKYTVRKENLWLLYRLTSNEFGHYGTVVSETIFK